MMIHRNSIPRNWLHLLIGCGIFFALVAPSMTAAERPMSRADTSNMSISDKDDDGNSNQLDFSSFEIEIPQDDTNDYDGGQLNKQEMQERDATILKVQLHNEGHSVLATWEVLNTIPWLSGFIVSYRMEGRENYDSSKLGTQVRNFTIHSLHEDRDYDICVMVLVNATQLTEVCECWSQASSNMVIGIIAGTTLMVPCIFFLVLILFKDRQIRRKMQAHGESSTEGGSKKCLINSDTIILNVGQFNQKENLQNNQQLKSGPQYENVLQIKGPNDSCQKNGGHGAQCLRSVEQTFTNHAK